MNVMLRSSCFSDPLASWKKQFICVCVFIRVPFSNYPVTYSTLVLLWTVTCTHNSLTNWG